MAGFRFIREDGAVPVDHRQLAEVSSYEPEPVEGPAPAVPYPDFAGQPGWQGEFWEYLENLPEKILMEIVLARRIAHVSTRSANMSLPRYTNASNGIAGSGLGTHTYPCRSANFFASPSATVGLRPRIELSP